MSVVFRIKGLHFYLSTPSINSVNQCSPTKQQESLDTWNEIDRRNEHVLNPLNSKSTFKSKNHFSIYHPQLTLNSNKSFYLNSYHSYRPRRRSSQCSDEQIYLNPSIYLNNYINKQTSTASINNDATFLFGNSIIKSNKADILNIFEQQLLNGDDRNICVNKHGVIIDENGPFWPENYRILHPTPKLLIRELTPKEFYLSPSMSSKKKKEKKVECIMMFILKFDVFLYA
jgi:hypothetical protein